MKKLQTSESNANCKCTLKSQHMTDLRLAWSN